MAEKMAEQIAEILKEPNFQTAEKALKFLRTDGWGIQESSGGYYCGTMD
jgi:hypothetical protein